METKTHLFALGQVMATSGVAQLMEDPSIQDELALMLARHLGGDYGDMCEEDKQANTDALKDEGRIMSSYLTSSNVKIWIITEWDRSVTTFLFPDEY